MTLALRSRDLGYAPGVSRGEPLLVVESARRLRSVFRVVEFGLSLAHRVERFLGRERRHRSRGSIAFYPGSVRIEREPVHELGERGVVRVDLNYADITRVEFVPPEMVILGYGVVAHGLNQQAALALSPLEAHDRFDAIVEILEARRPLPLFAALDDGELSYSARWTFAERFPDLGMVQEIRITRRALQPVLRWSLETDAGEEFLVTGGYGLVLTAADAPESAILQLFQSQVTDGTGFTLSRIELEGRRRILHTSHEERLALDPSGAIWLEAERIGFVPPDPAWQPRADQLSVVFGTAPAIVAVGEEEPEPRLVRFKRPLPTAWALLVALLSLLPPPAPVGVLPR